MDLTHANWALESPKLLELLKTASFVAIDEEMTGISTPDQQRIHVEETLQQRYDKIRAAPETYSIIQVGICLYHKVNGDDKYVATPYNIYTFPNNGRDISLSMGSIKFLKINNMDFGCWISSGVTFENSAGEAKLTQEYEKFAKKITEDVEANIKDKSNNSKSKSKSKNSNSNKLVVPERESDVLFVARSLASIRVFLDQSSSSNSLTLEPCNSFLRRILYQEIESNFPGLSTEKRGNDRIAVLRLNDNEKRARADSLKREGLAKLEAAVGVRKLFTALSIECKSRSMPIVCHNGTMDLLFLMSHFHSAALPQDWERAKEEINSFFPVVADTKYLHSLLESEIQEMKIANSYAQQRHPNNLIDLYTYLQNPLNFDSQTFGGDDEDGDDNAIDIVFADGFNKYKQGGFEHEAAFDAYLTGNCFLFLQAKLRTIETNLKGGNTSNMLLGINRLYTYMMLWSTNLAGDDVFVGCDRNLVVRSELRKTIRIEVKNGNRINMKNSDFTKHLWAGAAYATKWTSGGVNANVMDVFLISFAVRSEEEEIAGFVERLKEGEHGSDLAEVKSYGEFLGVGGPEKKQNVGGGGGGGGEGVFGWLKGILMGVGGAAKKRKRNVGDDDEDVIAIGNKKRVRI